MKTALCLSGHLRTFRHTFQALKRNVIDPLNCDVFIHTWDLIGGRPSDKTLGDAGFRGDRTVDHLAEIEQMYQPKYFQIEDESKIADIIRESNDIFIRPDELHFVVQHVGYHISMFYGVQAAHALMQEYTEEHNQQYQLIIRCRPDLQFHTRLSFEMFPHPNILYVPDVATYLEEGINDQFAIGSPSIMNQYAQIYPLVATYYRRHVCVARPEAVLRYHLNKFRVPTQAVDIQYEIFRLDGTIVRLHKWMSEILPGRHF